MTITRRLVYTYLDADAVVFAPFALRSYKSEKR